MLFMIITMSIILSKSPAMYNPTQSNTLNIKLHQPLKILLHPTRRLVPFIVLEIFCHLNLKRRSERKKITEGRNGRERKRKKDERKRERDTAHPKPSPIITT